jgi:hypothetical protein
MVEECKLRDVRSHLRYQTDALMHDEPDLWVSLYAYMSSVLYTIALAGPGKQETYTEF